jgi:hypothetical protein
MKTVDFSKVLRDTIQLCGLDADDFNLPTFKQLRDFISVRLKLAWEYDMFPDLIRIESANVITETVSNNTVYYVNKPTNAGEVVAIYNQNPYSGSRAVNIPFAIVGTDTIDRLMVSKNYTDAVWVEYRLIPPVLFGTPWNTVTTFRTGSQVYFDSGSNSGSLQPEEGKVNSGNFYNALVDSLNHNPATDTDKFAIVKIPNIFSTYLPRAAFADYLRSQGQFDNAIIAEKEAESLLDLEIDKIARQQGQIQKYNFIKTY